MVITVDEGREIQTAILEDPRGKHTPDFSEKRAGIYIIKTSFSGGDQFEWNANSKVEFISRKSRGF